MNLYQPTISGSLTVSGSVQVIGPFTMSGGSITGTASFAQNSGLLSNLDSGSFVGTGSFNTVSSSFSTVSSSFVTVSSSYSAASGSLSTRVTKIEGNYATTGSNVFTGAQTVCANITSTGTIIAQTLNVQQVTSSIVYSSGSNTFGCSLTDVQQFTGSVRITGSFNTIGNACFNNNINVDRGSSINLTNCVSCVDGLFGQINAGYGSGGTQNAASIEFIRTSLSWGDNGDIIFKTNPGNGTNTSRLRINNNGVSCFSGTTCAPGIDVMPSGIGVSTLGGIMRVVTTGTSTGIAVGQSNTNRYTHIAANDIQVFNDDFFLTTRCAFPLSIGTCYTARLTFAATGIACFSCRVCVPSLTAAGTITTTVSPGAYEANMTYLGTTFNLGASEVTDTIDFKICGASASTTGNGFAFWTQSGNTTPSQRLRIDKNGIACFACQVCAPSFLASTSLCVTSNNFTKGGPNSSIVTVTTTTTSGCTCAFSMGNNGYSPGVGDNVSGLVIVNVNEPNANIQLNSGIYVGMVNNPRGANACLIEISRNLGSSNLALKVSAGTGNNIDVCACSSSGISTSLRYTLTFIGGGGIS